MRWVSGLGRIRVSDFLQNPIWNEMSCVHFQVLWCSPRTWFLCLGYLTTLSAHPWQPREMFTGHHKASFLVQWVGPPFTLAVSGCLRTNEKGCGMLWEAQMRETSDVYTTVLAASESTKSTMNREGRLASKTPPVGSACTVNRTASALNHRGISPPHT